VIPAIAAAVAAAGLEASRRWWPRRWDPWLVLAVLLPPVVWTAQLTGLAVTTRVGWPVELWAGIVVVTTLAGWAMGLGSGAKAPSPDALEAWARPGNRVS
jgi:hypothetical protein